MKTEKAKHTADKLVDYDAGLLNDYGGGNVAWWQNYIRFEIDRANEYWRKQIEDCNAHDRLTEVNGELLAALEFMIDDVQDGYMADADVKSIRATIAKAKGK